MNRKSLLYAGYTLVVFLSGIALLTLLTMDIPAQTSEPAKIAFSSNRDGNWEIYVMDADGKN